jgi:hypothetical protein
MVPGAGLELCLETRMDIRFQEIRIDKYQQKYQQKEKCPRLLLSRNRMAGDANVYEKSAYNGIVRDRNKPTNSLR